MRKQYVKPEIKAFTLELDSGIICISNGAVNPDSPGQRWCEQHGKYEGHGKWENHNASEYRNSLWE